MKPLPDFARDLLAGLLFLFAVLVLPSLIEGLSK